MLSLVVQLPPTYGVPIVNHYAAVSVGVFELNVTDRFVVDASIFPGQVPDYVGDFLPGNYSIPTNIGMKHIEGMVSDANRL